MSGDAPGTTPRYSLRRRPVRGYRSGLTSMNRLAIGHFIAAQRNDRSIRIQRAGDTDHVALRRHDLHIDAMRPALLDLEDVIAMGIALQRFAWHRPGLVAGGVDTCRQRRASHQMRCPLGWQRDLHWHKMGGGVDSMTDHTHLAMGTAE